MIAPVRSIFTFLFLLTLIPSISTGAEPSAGYSALEKRFRTLRNAFDSRVDKCADQAAVNELSDKYENALKSLLADSLNAELDLPKNIQGEIDRLKPLRSQYLEAPSTFRRLVLSENWDDKPEYLEAIEDFRKVIPDITDLPNPSPQIEADFGKNQTILQKPFLCPINEFVESIEDLKGLKATDTRVPIGMPGFPKASFYYHSYDGIFSNPAKADQLNTQTTLSFNKLFVITDSKDQVVGVQFTSESPSTSPQLGSTEIRIFNFVQFRRAGSPQAIVSHTMRTSSSGYHLLTSLSVNNKCKEINLLIMPKAMVSLLQHTLRIRS